MATVVSDGRWKCFGHLEVIDRALLDVAHGRCRRLLVMLPPRHGKSELISRYFPAWYLGRFPDKKIILASYEADFAAQWGRKARDLLEEFGPHLFNIRVRADSHAANRWEIAKHEGTMFTAGAGGAITGKGASVAIIDDPVKNAEEAASEVYRARTWDWFQSTLKTRLEKHGAIIIVMTRWAPDDLAGRVMAEQAQGGDEWRVIRMPALAEEREDWGPFMREKGDALCPELIPKDQLEALAQDDYWFATLYQQRPYAKSGQKFRRMDFEIVDSAPSLRVSIRAWDLAGTESKSAKRTAGILLGLGVDGFYYVVDVVKGKWIPGERDGVIKSVAEVDGKNVSIVIEQEPGSGGKAQVHALVRILQGWNVKGVAMGGKGSKVVRADAVASQSNIGRVRLVRSAWNHEFVSELESFPGGRYCDQVDALSLAFNTLISGANPVDFGRKAKLPISYRDQLSEMTGHRRASSWRDEMPM